MGREWWRLISRGLVPGLGRVGEKTAENYRNLAKLFKNLTGERVTAEDGIKAKIAMTLLQSSAEKDNAGWVKRLTSKDALSFFHQAGELPNSYLLLVATGTATAMSVNKAALNDADWLWKKVLKGRRVLSEEYKRAFDRCAEARRRCSVDAGIYTIGLPRSDWREVARNFSLPVNESTKIFEFGKKVGNSPAGCLLTEHSALLLDTNTPGSVFEGLAYMSLHYVEMAEAYLGAQGPAFSTVQQELQHMTGRRVEFPEALRWRNSLAGSKWLNAAAELAVAPPEREITALPSLAADLSGRRARLTSGGKVISGEDYNKFLMRAQWLGDYGELDTTQFPAKAAQVLADYFLSLELTRFPDATKTLQSVATVADLRRW